MGHELKLVKRRARLDFRKYFLSNRIVDEWNKLGDDVTQCYTVLCLISREN